MPLTETQRQTIRECSKDEAAYQQLLALYEEVTDESTSIRFDEQSPLRNSRRVLDKILMTLPGLFYIYDAVDGRSIFVNNYLVTDMGYSIPEFRAMGDTALTLLIHPDDASSMMNHLRKVMAEPEGTVYPTQYRMKHHSGAWLWFHAQHTVFSWDDEGRARTLLGVAVNITRLRQVEATLNERQYFINRIMDTIPDIVYVFDATTRELEYANQEKIHTLGYTWHELHIRNFDDLLPLIHPDDRAWLADAPAWYQQAGDDDALEAEYRMRAKDGEWHWMYGRQIVFDRSPDGSPRQILGISQDITLRKAASDALLESENRQKALLRALPDLMFLLNADGIILGFHAPEPELLYVSPDQLIGKHTRDVIPPDVAALQLHHIALAMNTGRVTSFEYELDLPQRGERHSFEARLAASDSNTVVMLVRDVTRYKQIIDALTDSEYRQNALLEAILDLMFIIDRHGSYLDYYASQPQLLYSQPDEFLGKRSTDFLPEHLARQEMAAIHQVLASRQPVDYDYQLTIGDRVYDFESRMVAHSEDTVLLIVRDISARKQAELALRESLNREKTLLQAIPDLIFVFDRDGTYVDVHAPVPEQLLIPADELKGKRIIDVVPPELAHHINYIHRTLDSKQMVQYEYSLVLGDRLHHFECRMVPRDEDTVLSMVRDVTEKKQAESVLLQQERLEVALQKEQELSRYKSRLMMTLNHELRTPLAIISTNSALLERYSSTMPPEKQSSRLRQIQKQTQHIGAIMDNIHRVLEGQTERIPAVFSVFDLDDLCQQKVEALQSASGTTHHLTFTSDGKLHSVYADERLIDSILINLLTNALKYSPVQTTITVSLVAQGSDAIIEVSDQGIGIFPEDLIRIYEPFFRGSNSGDSGGLGLGMSIVRDAVDALNGRIDIHSTPNKGTTFIITLPGIRYAPKPQTNK